MCQIIYCVKVGYFWCLKSGLSRHNVLAIPQILIKFCCTIRSVKKLDTMCELIYCVKFGFLWSFLSGLKIHILLAITGILIQFYFIN